MTSKCPIRRQFRFITTVILALPLWFCCYLQQVHSWTSQSLMRTSFVRMDTEIPHAPFATTWKHSSSSKPPTAFLSFDGNNQKKKTRFPQAEKHGMPWKTSIDTRKPSDCLFMPFWESQLDHWDRHLSNFTIDKDHFVENKDKHVRMVTLSCSSDEYRLIRMTYLDGGNQTQIFTSVAYPRGNLPILGCDFLSFQGGKRTLAIVDFQPIHSEESGHDATYEHLLEPIRHSYKSLQEPMSCRFFDPSQFFSGQTLMGRFGVENKGLVWSEVMPAWQAYMQTHVGMTKQHSLNPRSLDIEAHHSAYDTYCLQRDPAHPMFNALFGPDFADDFLYNTMFPLAEPVEEEGQQA